jgi:hypothetical protein
MLLLGCILVRNLFGESLPKEIELAARRDRSVTKLAACVQDRFLRPSDYLASMVRAPWFHIQCRERLRDRIRYLARGILSPELDDVLFLTLPRLLFPLYRLLHPARILSAYSRSVLLRMLSVAKTR